MYRIETDKENAILSLSMEGFIRMDEMKQFVEELQAATTSLAGHDIKILADMRSFRASGPEVADSLRQVQEFGLRNGVKRVAEMVQTPLAALQLNRVARGSGTDRILRRFTDKDKARRWLISGEVDAADAAEEAAGG